jgi:group I intron endonuclease
MYNAVIYWIHLPKHTEPTTEGYIGVAKDVGKRLKGHLADITKGKHNNLHLVNAVNKYGWDSLVKDIWLFGEEAYCYEMEERLRPKKAIGWNIAPGGHRGPGKPKGFKPSKESIDKQKNTVKINNADKKRNILLKKQQHLEQKQAVSVEKKKIAQDKKIARAKIGALNRIKSNTGKTRNDIHKKNMSVGWENRFAEGKGTGREGKPRNTSVYSFVHHEFGIEKCTQLELRKKYNLSQGNLGSMCRGDRESVSGWKIDSK